MLVPQLNRASTLSPAPRHSPVRSGRCRTIGAKRAVVQTSPRLKNPPTRPAAIPIGIASISCSFSGAYTLIRPKPKIGSPPRFENPAAATHTSKAGQIVTIEYSAVSSSSMNTTPSRGVLKPPARPAPPPMATICRSVRAGIQLGQRFCVARATAAPNCTTGPSRPRGNMAAVATDQRIPLCRVLLASIASGINDGSSSAFIVEGIPDPAPPRHGPR